MWFQIVVSLKFYRPLYMMGARLSWPVKKLRGGQHKCEYICEYSTNFKYCCIIGLQLNIPIRICIIIWVLGLSLRLQFENKNYKSNIRSVFRIEAYIRCCIKITMLNLKGLTCQGGRMNPLEHIRYWVVSNCGITKILHAIVHDGCRISWPVNIWGGLT